MIVNGFFLLCGVLLVQQLALLPDVKMMVGLWVVTGILFLRQHWPLFFLCFAVSGSILFAQLRLNDQLDESLQGRDITIQGIVNGLPAVDENRVRFDIKVIQADAEIPDLIRISWYWPDTSIKAGQRWKMNVRLKKPHGHLNTAGFDYQKWLFEKGIGATGYVRNKPKPELLDDISPFSLSVLRQKIADQVYQNFQQSQHLGLVLALSLGERGKLDKHHWEVLRRTGTSHLVAISGLHIGLIASLAFYIGRRGWQLTGIARFSSVQAGIYCALLAAVFYAFLAGFMLPTQRSLVMLGLIMLAVLWKRHINVRHVFVYTFCLVVLMNPMSILSASLWLSFGAVGLILFLLAGRLKQGNAWMAMGKINVLIGVGLMPILMLNFQQISLISPIANILAVPLLSLCVVPLLFCAVIFLWISPVIAEILFSLLEHILNFFWEMLAFFAGLPAASMETHQPGLIAVLLALVGVLLCFSPKGIPARYLGIVLCFPLIFNQHKPLSEQQFRFSLLDVGQGLAGVIQTRNHILVYDAGPRYSSRFDMGQQVVIPVLKSLNATQLDTLLVSHADNDHSGGVQSILAHLPVDDVIVSSAGIVDRQYSLCQSKQNWVWDGVQFNLLSPPSTRFFNGKNNNSCVLQVSTPDFTLLLTGDIEQEAEQWLVNEYAETLRSDVLVAPHHGSQTSSSQHFLQHVAPHAVLISAGYKNRYRMPHKHVINRYERLGIKWWNTADTGAMTFDSTDWQNPELLNVTQGKYWHRQSAMR